MMKMISKRRGIMAKAALLTFIIMCLLTNAVSAGEAIEEGYYPDAYYSEGDMEGKPYWYPEDVDSFVPFHDPDAPRVVDDAGIFTEEEEAKMEDIISDIIAATNKDVVIFTDNNTYGLPRNIYCYDFYDFCGYGIGETYDGMCLFINMDPNERGWESSSTGVVEDMYTEDIANEMDDALYEYLSAGNYYAGVIDWIGNVFYLYTTGYPFTAEWLPGEEERDSFERTHDPQVDRIYDSADILTDNDEELLRNLSEDYRDMYGIDIVIHTTKHTYQMSDKEYADAFYYYNGFGQGDSFDGILLTIFPGYDNRSLITAYGETSEKLAGINLRRMKDHTEKNIEDSYFYIGAYNFVSDAAHLEKTGRVNHTFFEWFIRLLIAACSGGLVGGIMLLSARGRMKTVRAAFNADSYTDGTKSIIPLCDEFLNERVTRTKIVRTSYSSSSSSYSGSSHRSSYHSHSSGSSGRSHTSSGRRF